MMKKYSSYKEIQMDLKVLHLQREIAYQKLVASIDKTKQNLQPKNLISDFIGLKGGTNTTIYPYLLSAVIPLVIDKGIPLIKKWMSKKKRGD